MGPSNRQARGYKLKSQFLSPHFALDSDRFYEILCILIRDPDNQITVRISSVKVTQFGYSPKKFVLIQERIACVVVKLAPFQHRSGKGAMSFVAIALDKKIKILLYYRYTVVRVMAEFSEYIGRSSVHCPPNGKTRHSRPTVACVDRPRSATWLAVNPLQTENEFNPNVGGKVADLHKQSVDLIERHSGRSPWWWSKRPSRLDQRRAWFSPGAGPAGGDTRGQISTSIISPRDADPPTLAGIHTHTVPDAAVLALAKDEEQHSL
ncbi:hypothetical protein [Mycobacterium sp. 1465703.0]|uniref:hypothetical protein n=1 Tax=Mycobacterium sp. 1465703.0 TaxID=1834078 RepID=UPI000A76E388